MATTWTSSPGRASSVQSRKSTREGGFTFLELILVVVLTGLIAGLALPAMSGVLDRTKRNTALREIVSSMRYARSQAVSAKTPILFQADLQEHRYWLENPRTEEKSPVKNLDPQIRFNEFSEGNDQYDSGTITIVFYPRGNTSGGTLTLTPPDVRGDRTRFEVRVDAVTGKPQVDTYEE